MLPAWPGRGRAEHAIPEAGADAEVDTRIRVMNAMPAVHPPEIRAPAYHQASVVEHVVEGRIVDVAPVGAANGHRRDA